MVYLAILLILCGLLILITALSVETGRINLAGSSGRPSDYDNTDSGSEEVEVIFPGYGIKESADEEDIFISFDDEPDDEFDSNRFIKSDDLVAERSSGRSFRSAEEIYTEDRIKPDYADSVEADDSDTDFSAQYKGDSGKVSAIMFDDRSNIIDYESGVGAIDSTFSKYKSIKRIGKGIIESDYDGINFYLDEKLYRFDFHKVYDIWSGSDYVALPLKGNSTVKLFLIQNSPSFPGKVEADFKEYEKGL